MGNSLSIRIPAAVAAEIGAETRGGLTRRSHLVLKPVSWRRRSI